MPRSLVSSALIVILVCYYQILRCAVVVTGSTAVCVNSDASQLRGSTHLGVCVALRANSVDVVCIR
eukprot:m.83880 g.83880  ORF g.83880 m.83880 type:complete len:66 (+) comp19669_c0_seq1:349-546(+)